ncbi:MAG TPA: hypothetical protein VMR08_01010 [Patescibacteria group bacterium]|jgi:hypothetical protein|nr:hypothetical protein [Patescibacteria group bacterium]
MNKSKIIRISIIVIILIFVGAAGFYAGWSFALSKLTVKTITPTQAANAMKNDDFYSNYNENMLEIHGVVASITDKNNDLVIGLATNSTYKTYCDLGHVPTKPQKESLVTVMAGGATARRQPNAVVLNNCVEL